MFHGRGEYRKSSVLRPGQSLSKGPLESLIKTGISLKTHSKQTEGIWILTNKMSRIGNAMTSQLKVFNVAYTWPHHSNV